MKNNFFDRINVWKIFIAHKDTLYDYAKLKKDNTRIVSKADKFTFIYIPLILSTTTVLLLDLKINTDYLNVIITSLSIFVGLLFSLLTLVFDLIKKEKPFAVTTEASNDIKNKYQLLKELFVNISFAISLSILTILITLSTQLKANILTQYFLKFKYYQAIKDFYLNFTNTVAIYFVLLFIMTLLMILKRFFIVFQTEINEGA